jgi:ribosomal protein L21
MQAVIKIGSHQHLVSEGDELVVDKQIGAEKTLVFEPLLVFDENSTFVGTPMVEGAKVTVDVITPEQKGKKIKIMKFQAKKRVKKLTGHRQTESVLSIKNIALK